MYHDFKLGDTVKLKAGYKHGDFHEESIFKVASIRGDFLNLFEEDEGEVYKNFHALYFEKIGSSDMSEWVATLCNEIYELYREKGAVKDITVSYEEDKLFVQLTGVAAEAVIFFIENDEERVEKLESIRQLIDDGAITRENGKFYSISFLER